MNDRAARTAQNRIAALQRQRDGEIDAAFQALMQHAQGRRAVNWLLQITSVGKSPYTGNAISTAFACGEHNVGLQVLNRVQAAAPDLYSKMVKEINDESARDAATLARSNAEPESDTGTGEAAGGDPDSFPD